MTEPNPECPICDGEGTYDIQWRYSSDGIKTEVCECCYPDEDDAYDEWRDDQLG